MKKLYVGNLSYDTTNDSLKDAFSKFGNVTSASVITDKMSGRSRGFGFVEFDSDEEGLAAIDGLNGQEVDGRKITVNEARPMTDRPPRRPGGGGGFNRGGGSGRGFGGGRDY